MKAIIDNKLYDTNTAKLLFTYVRRYPTNLEIAPGLFITNPHNIAIYRTKNRAYFEHDEKAGTITLSSEANTQKIMMDIDPDQYMRTFDVKIEEG